MNDVLSSSLTQLAAQTPTLLVYFTGAVLALVFWRRSPMPCLLALIASVLLLVVTVVQTFAFQYLLIARVEQGWEHDRLGWMLSVVALVGNALRALGFGLLLAAVFVGRRPARVSDGD